MGRKEWVKLKTEEIEAVIFRWCHVLLVFDKFANLYTASNAENMYAFHVFEAVAQIIFLYEIHR